MKRGKLWRAALLAFALASGRLPWASHARAADIDLTAALGADPEVVKAIAKLCNSVCLGNQRKSWLDRFVFHAELAHPSITVQIKLRSRHAPFRGLVAYEEVSKVRVDADVSISDCSLTNVRASSGNAIYRLLLRSLKGRIEAAVRRHSRFC